MIIILALLLSFIFYISYKKSKNRFLSPTVISSAIFLLFTIIYIISLNTIKSDISWKTMLVIVCSIVFTWIGEYIMYHIKIYRIKTYKRYRLELPRYRTYFFFIIMIFIAVWRFYDLYLFSLLHGNTSGLLGTLSSIRLVYATGGYTGGNVFTVLGTTISEILCYLYVFVFTYEWIVNKRKIYRNSLPILGYCLIAISFTGRTEYLKIITVFAVSYIYSMYTIKENFNINKKIAKKTIKIGLSCAIFFFLYGYITRDVENKMTSQIVAYSSAGMIGLDKYMDTPWEENPYFGYYTLQKTYSFIGVDNNQILQPHHLRFFYYGDNGSSNIYTSLVLPIQDYGITFMLISRLVIALISAFLIRKTLNMRLNNAMFFCLLIFISMLIFAYIFSPIADKFKDILLAPSTIIKYTLYCYIVVRYFAGYKATIIERSE